MNIAGVSIITSHDVYIFCYVSLIIQCEDQNIQFLILFRSQIYFNKCWISLREENRDNKACKQKQKVPSEQSSLNWLCVCVWVMNKCTHEVKFWREVEADEMRLKKQTKTKCFSLLFNDKCLFVLILLKPRCYSWK